MEITQHARYTCTFCGKVSQTLWTCEDRVDSDRGGHHAGLRKAPGRRHLEVQLVQEGHRWWRVDCLDNGGCDRSQVRTISACTARTLRLMSRSSTVRRLREITEA